MMLLNAIDDQSELTATSRGVVCELESLNHTLDPSEQLLPLLASVSTASYITL